MLQWMGGSRRKVTTSRKSTQKRQKQYFEQRKRQQQQLHISELQSDADGANIYGQHQKEHRSLDILGFLNVEATDKAVLCNAVKRKENLEVNASAMKCNSIKGPSTTLINTVTPMDLVELEEAGTPSQYRMETESPNKDSDYHISSSKGIDDKLECCRTATEQQFSVLDLLVDDGPNVMSEEIPGHEAHVAFSVEGLGKVGTETPIHSPQPPSRTFSYDCSSSLNGARQPNSLKNLDFLLDELEVDGVMQDIDMPLSGNSFDLPPSRMDSFHNLKQKLSTARSSERHDGSGYRIKSSFHDKENFYDIASNDGDTWGASSSLLDDVILEDRECDISCKNWAYQMHGTSVFHLNYGNHEMMGHAFEDPLLKKRNAAKATDWFNISEPHAPYSKHQISEDYYNFKASDVTRHSKERWKFDFGEVTTQPDWSYFVKEDGRDSLSLLSEESCSSTAVRGEVNNNSPLCSTSREYRRRHGNGFGSHGNKYSVKNIYAKETQYNEEDHICQGHNGNLSGKYAGISNPSRSKPCNNSSFPFQEKLGPLDSWLFEEGFTSLDASPDFSSFCEAPETELMSSRSKHWTRDNLGVFPAPEPHNDAKLSDKSKHGIPNEYAPSCSFFSGECEFGQPFSHIKSYNSPVSLKAGPTKVDLSPDRAMEGMQPGLSHVSGSYGKVPMQDTVRKEEGISEFQPTSCQKFEIGEEFCSKNNSSSSGNGRAVVTSNSKENGSGCKEAKDGSPDILKNLGMTTFVDQEEETSSSVKIPGKFESSLNEEEYQQDVKTPLPCQSACKDTNTTDAGPMEIKITGERHDNSAASPHTVLMLESYVLQLLCVHKILKEASAQDAIKKV